MDLNIEKIITDQLAQEVRDADIESIIREEVRTLIAKGVGGEIVDNIKAVSKHMIAEEVRKALDGEVRTDDGWGKKTVYSSFEDLFKTTFKQAMGDTYQVEREITRQVSLKVESLVRKEYSQVIEKIVSALLTDKENKNG